MRIPYDIETMLCEIYECEAKKLPSVLSGMSADAITRALCEWKLGDPAWWDVVNRWNAEAKKIAETLHAKKQEQ